jgi:methylmalonyl-CoA mutase, C-terminal domain
MAAAAARPLRILLCKLGMDTHTVGLTVVAHALREAGMEVIFTGLKQTPQAVASAAIQEDVDVVGVSSLSAGHTRSLPRLAQLLREQGGGDKLLVAGGVIPAEDLPLLTAAGFARVFTMGTDTRDIVAYLQAWWRERLAAADPVR